MHKSSLYSSIASFHVKAWKIISRIYFHNTSLLHKKPSFPALHIRPCIGCALCLFPGFQLAPWKSTEVSLGKPRGVLIVHPLGASAIRPSLSYRTHLVKSPVVYSSCRLPCYKIGPGFCDGLKYFFFQFTILDNNLSRTTSRTFQQVLIGIIIWFTALNYLPTYWNKNWRRKQVPVINEVWGQLCRVNGD